MSLKIQISPEFEQWFSEKYPAFPYTVVQSGNFSFKCKYYNLHGEDLGSHSSGTKLHKMSPQELIDHKKYLETLSDSRREWRHLFTRDFITLGMDRDISDMRNIRSKL